MPKMCSIHSLSDLFELAGSNPDLASALKSDPAGVALEFGVTLTQNEINKISQNLDLSQTSSWATQVDSYAAKVEQGVGL